MRCWMPPFSRNRRYRLREGQLIKEGYDEQVDRFATGRSTEGKTWLAELEAKEKEATGINNAARRLQPGFRILY